MYGSRQSFKQQHVTAMSFSDTLLFGWLVNRYRIVFDFIYSENILKTNETNSLRQKFF
jgi:hypothetical protein